MKPIEIRRASWRESCEFIRQHHRHHPPTTGWIWGLAGEHNGRLVGIAQVGRPNSRILQSRGYLEVTRTCTVVWGLNRIFYEVLAAWATTARHRLCTYTLEYESGRSIELAGWRPVARRTSRPSDWHGKRPQLAARIRWEP